MPVCFYRYIFLKSQETLVSGKQLGFMIDNADKKKKEVKSSHGK